MSNKFHRAAKTPINNEAGAAAAEDLDQEAIAEHLAAQDDDSPDPTPETVEIEPAVPQPPKPAEGKMAYLGTLYPQGALARSGKGSSNLAGLPIVVKTGGRIAGVVVVSDPGFAGEALNLNLEQAGLVGPFEQIQPARLSGSEKLAAARAIVEERDPAVDVSSALAAFGLTLAHLGY